MYTFLTALAESGQVSVKAPGSATGHATDEVAVLLAELDERARAGLPHEAPAFDPAAAQWAAERLYQACQFLVYREVDAATIHAALSPPCPHAMTASVCYSVDLVFRWLPDLTALARGIAEDDPLVRCLSQLGRDWPLSSVGTPGLGPVDPMVVTDDPCLRQLYVDRILERADTSRLDDPRVADLARAALGLYRLRCPAAAAVLFPETADA